MNLLLVTSWFWGNLYKFSFISRDVHIPPLDFVVGSMSIIYLVGNYKICKKLLNKYRTLATSIMLFALIAIISLILGAYRFGFDAGLVGSFYLIRWIVYSSFFITFGSKIQINKQVETLHLLRILGLGTVTLGILQYLLYPDIRTLAIAEWDPHYYRVVSTFLDPSFTGIIIVFTIILFTLKPLHNRILNLLVWLVSYFTLALTYSRSSYLAFLAAFAWISWHKKSWKLFLGIIMLSIVTVYLLPRSPDGEGVKLERTSTIQARIINWKNTLFIFAKNPVLGVGFNTYRYAQNKYGLLIDSKWLKSHAGAGADSSLLFVAATTGIIGLLAYLWYLKLLYGLRTMNHELQVTLIALLVHSLFLNSLFYPTVMLWLSLLVIETN